MNNTAIIPGSLKAISQQSNKSIAETFVGCDVVILVDTSGSMNYDDAPGGLTRYDAACRELQQLQQNLPGKIAVVSFSDCAQFCPSGIPINLQGSTNLAKALQFIRIADVDGIKFIVISDGQPDDEQTALDEARKFRNRINVIYVGPETRPAGRDFLQRLAAATGGQTVTADCTKELSATVTRLLLTA